MKTKPPLVYGLSEFDFKSVNFSRKAFTPYALAIGQSTLAWNFLHERLSDLFNDILYALGLDTPENTYGLAVWNSSTVDRAKRKMLQALTDSLYEGCFVRKRSLCFPKGRVAELQAAIGFILKEANSLEDARNNAIHAPLMSNEDDECESEPTVIKVTPFDSFGNYRAQRMVGKDLLAEYRYLRDSARTLANYTAAVMESFLQFKGEPVAWPSIPRMPTREQKIRRPSRLRRPLPKSSSHRRSTSQA